MIPKLSFSESLTFNLLYSFPNYLQGLFTRRRFWVGLWSGIQGDRMAVRFVSRLRARYRSGYFFTRVGGSDALLVLDHAGIRHILENSPTMYGDAASKHRGMSHFQPGAVTISRGELSKIINKVSAALEQPYEELLVLLPFEDTVNVDETGHKGNGKTWWTWCFRAEL